MKKKNKTKINKIYLLSIKFFIIKIILLVIYRIKLKTKKKAYKIYFNKKLI